MRENENEQEQCQKLPAQALLMPKEKSHLQCLVWGFYSQTPFTNYQNNQNNNYYRGINWEEIQKVTKEVKKSKA